LKIVLPLPTLVRKVLGLNGVVGFRAIDALSVGSVP
jgi:hypothetical protein